MKTRQQKRQRDKFIIVRTEECDDFLNNEGHFTNSGRHRIYDSYAEALTRATFYCNDNRSYYIAKMVAKVEIDRPIKITRL